MIIAINVAAANLRDGARNVGRLFGRMTMPIHVLA
jgi:hypothetical protein